MRFTLSQQMESYAAYHRDTRNRITHFFGVPLVTFSLFIPLGWFRFIHADIPITAAAIFYFFVFIYYFRLDRVVALVQAPVTFALLYYADIVSLMPFKASALIFAATFVGGWLIQLLGHAFEGKRPALADNLIQLFNGPLFLTVEILIFLGFRQELKAKLNAV